MDLKGVKIEKGPTFWHVSKKNANNSQGYVEIGKFVLFDSAFDLAKKTVETAVKGGAA